LLLCSVYPVLVCHLPGGDESQDIFAPHPPWGLLKSCLFLTGSSTICWKTSPQARNNPEQEATLQGTKRRIK